MVSINFHIVNLPNLFDDDDDDDRICYRLWISYFSHCTFIIYAMNIFLSPCVCVYCSLLSILIIFGSQSHTHRCLIPLGHYLDSSSRVNKQNGQLIIFVSIRKIWKQRTTKTIKLYLYYTCWILILNILIFKFFFSFSYIPMIY